jgi:hypothetical protein
MKSSLVCMFSKFSWPEHQRISTLSSGFDADLPWTCSNKNLVAGVEDVGIDHEVAEEVGVGRDKILGKTVLIFKICRSILHLSV